MLNRWTENGSPNLYEALEQVGAGSIAFSPLAQGMLTDRYLNGIPADSRAAQDKSLDQGMITEDKLDRVRGLQPDRRRPRADAGADGHRLDPARAGQGLVRDLRAGRRVQRPAARGHPRPRSTTSTSRREELTAIDEFAVESDINLWAQK